MQQNTLRTAVSFGVIIIPILFGILFLLLGAPIPVFILILIIVSVYLIVSLEPSDINTHYYITMFGKNMGIMSAGGGIYFLPRGFFELHEISTEIIEQVYPAPEEKISFVSDTEPLPDGKVRTYRITTSSKNRELLDPLDVEDEIRDKIIQLNQELNQLTKELDKDNKNDLMNPLTQRLTLEPRFMVKFRPLKSVNGEDDAEKAEIFFQKFDGIDDLTRAIGLTTVDILTNIFGRLTPDAILIFQEIISKIVTVRLIGIFQSKGTEIIHFGLINPGIPKSVSEEIRTAAKARASKDKTITDAQAQREATILEAQGTREQKILVGQGEAEATKLSNQADLEKQEKEAIIKANASYLLYEAEAKGITELAKSLGLKDDEKKLIKILETFEKGMKDNNLNIIMGGDTNLDTFLKMAMQKLSQPNTTKTN